MAKKRRGKALKASSKISKASEEFDTSLEDEEEPVTQEASEEHHIEHHTVIQAAESIADEMSPAKNNITNAADFIESFGVVEEEVHPLMETYEEQQVQQEEQSEQQVYFDEVISQESITESRAQMYVDRIHNKIGRPKKLANIDPADENILSVTHGAIKQIRIIQPPSTTRKYKKRSPAVKVKVHKEKKASIGYVKKPKDPNVKEIIIGYYGGDLSKPIISRVPKTKADEDEEEENVDESGMEANEDDHFEESADQSQHSGNFSAEEHTESVPEYTIQYDTNVVNVSVAEEATEDPSFEFSYDDDLKDKLYKSKLKKLNKELNEVKAQNRQLNIVSGVQKETIKTLQTKVAKLSGVLKALHEKNKQKENLH